MRALDLAERSTDTRTRILILFFGAIWNMANRGKSELRWVTPPQQVRSQETLDRILASAEELVAEKGFDDASIAEIVRRAGSSVGAFYSRFEDKHALLHALSGRFVEQAMATADEALDPTRWQGASISEILHAVVRFLVSIYREQSGLMRATSLRWDWFRVGQVVFFVLVMLAPFRWVTVSVELTS